MVVKTLTVSSPRKRLGLKTYLQFLGVVAVVATIKCVDGVGIQTHEVHGVIKNVNVNYNEKMGRQQCYLTIDTPEQSIQPRQGFSCIDRMRSTNRHTTKTGI